MAKVKIKQVVENFAYGLDDDAEMWATKTIELDSSTFDEILAKLGDENKQVSAERLLQYIHDNSVGKISALGEDKLVKKLECGDLVISLQLSYYLWCERKEKYGDEAVDHYEDKMTEEEWNKIVGDYPQHTFFDVAIFTKDGDNFLAPTQESMYGFANRLNDLIKDHEIDNSCFYH